jgi:hypothetical protein
MPLRKCLDNQTAGLDRRVRTLFIRKGETTAWSTSDRALSCVIRNAWFVARLVGLVWQEKGSSRACL